MDNPELADAVVKFAIAALGLATIAIQVILAPKVATWLKAEEDKATARGHGEQVATARELATTAVRWAEQRLSGAEGAAKREAAAGWLWKLAAERGIEMPLTDAERLIEEAVLVLKATGLDLQTVEAKRERARDPKTGRFIPAKEST